MRERRPFLLLVVVCGAAVLALSGCGVGATPAPTVTTTATVTASPSPSSISGTGSGFQVLGSCTFDASKPYKGTATYVITAPTGTSVKASMSAFDADGTIASVTRTVTGPVATFVSYPCTDAAGSYRWVLTAEVGAGETGPVTCASFFDGLLVHDDTAGGEDTSKLTADCTGNPGGA